MENIKILQVLRQLENKKTIVDPESFDLLLEDLREIFFIYKNKMAYELIKKEIYGFDIEDELPEYRKKINIIFEKREVDPILANATKNEKVKSLLYSPIYSDVLVYKNDIQESPNITYSPIEIDLVGEILFFKCFQKLMLLELEKIELDNFN